jgi:osmoprotectant transport system substrate-binding protein
VRSRARSLLATIAVIATACAGGASAPPPDATLRDDAITIGSFNFGESVLLAELYAQALEARGITVVRELNLGPRELVEPALEKGLVELVPEYAGSLLRFLVGDSAATSPEQTHEELQDALERRGLAALDPAPAQDQNGFAVTRELADRLRLDSLSDLAGTDGLVLGGPPECPQRPLCEPGLEGTYGISFASFVPLDQSGPLTSDALLRGVADVALMFTSSAEIVRHGFVLLADDRHLQPADNVVPVVQAPVLDRFGPDLAETLNAVSAGLTTEELRSMNAEIEVDGREPRVVAYRWLVAHGLIPGEG